MKDNKADIFKKLARHLDSLPAGFPPTPSGVEIRILQKLFSEEEAALSLHLTLLKEKARAIAFRAGQPQDQVASLLATMANKGLISSSHSEGKKPTYAISQFVVGFYEDQVNRLDAELAALFEAYVPTWFQGGPWKKQPQIRTIPINESIPFTSEVMHYDQASQILRSKTHIAVRNCICRQERELLNKGCGKPMETCLSFDSAAESTVATGKGRMILLDEALDILEQAKSAGLVLQPANSQNPIFMCACCDCCCGVLRQIKQEPNPGDLVANPFIVEHQPALCITCGECVEICPMDALTQDQGTNVHLQQERCIGCGLCVSVCPTQALQMVRKPAAKLPKTPKNTLSTYIGISRARGMRNLFGLLWMVIKSKLISLLRLR